MKILYDGQIYADQIAGGIGRYFTNIINRLPESAQPTLTASYRRNKHPYPSHPHLQLQEFPNFRPHRIAHKLRGQYFRWAAHDDICGAELLAKCVAVLDANPDVVLCSTRIVKIDERGFIYSVDRAGSGMHVLRLTEDGKKAAGLPP